jgi:hypothetical protein
MINFRKIYHKICSYLEAKKAEFFIWQTVKNLNALYDKEQYTKIQAMCSTLDEAKPNNILNSALHNCMAQFQSGHNQCISARLAWDQFNHMLTKIAEEQQRVKNIKTQGYSNFLDEMHQYCKAEQEALEDNHSLTRQNPVTNVWEQKMNGSWQQHKDVFGNNILKVNGYDTTVSMQRCYEDFQKFLLSFQDFQTDGDHVQLKAMKKNYTKAYNVINNLEKLQILKDYQIPQDSEDEYMKLMG